MNAVVECTDLTLHNWKDLCIPVALNDSVNEKSPVTSEYPTAYALLLSGVEPWPIPSALKKKMKDEKLQFGMICKKIACSISMTFYHVLSKKFFGSTFVGHEYVVSTEATNIPISVKNFNEIMYFQSRIRDPNCFAVIELVMSTFDSVSDEVSNRYGCGWTIINPFEFEVDKEHQSNDIGSCKLITSGNLCVYRGSPRELVTKKGDGKDVLKHFNSTKMDTFIPYKLWNFESLNRVVMTWNIIQENQIVCAVTEIGTLANTAVNFLDSRGRTGGAIIGAISSGDELSWTLQPPDTISLGDKCPLKITNIALEVPQREEFESAMCSYADETVPKKNKIKIFAWNKMDTTQRTKSRVSNRRLKIGLHNGYNLLRNHWMTVDLVVSEEDSTLKSLDDVVVSDFVKHCNCAIVLIFEYTIMRSPKKIAAGDMVRIVIGAGVLCPFDGEKFCLQHNATNDHNVILPIKCDSACVTFTDGTVFSQNREPPRLKCCMDIPDTAVTISGHCAEIDNEPPSTWKKEKVFDQQFVANAKSEIISTESKDNHELSSVTPLFPELNDAASCDACALSTLTFDEMSDNSLVNKTIIAMAQLPSDNRPQKELHQQKVSNEFDETFEKSKTDPETVYALNLLDSSDELRILFDRICGVETTKSNTSRSRHRDHKSSLRQRQLDAVRRHQRQRKENGNTEILEELFNEFTPNLVSFDSASRALNAVQWYRESNKSALIVRHIQDLKQGYV